jgi:hypothetical protein
MKEEFVCGQEYWPLIPNGTYEVQCIKYDRKFVLGKARKLFLHFIIIEPGEHFGKKIFMAFNIPYDTKIRPGSKYYKTWVMVNGYRKPSRNATMSPRLFMNKVFKVKTRTAKPKHNDREMPEDFHYSVVDSIIEVVVNETTA